MAPIVRESNTALEERRQSILDHLELTRDEFEAVKDSRTLTAEEVDAREDLAEIEFLLGE